MCCKSCGIKIECQKCNIIACKHCICEHHEVCNCLKRKLELIEKMRIKKKDKRRRQLKMINWKKNKGIRRKLDFYIHMEKDVDCNIILGVIF
jgi:hypothetical protein